MPTYAYCKVLQFTIFSYRTLFYDILSPHEKKDYHAKAIDILEKDARKCSTCGNGEFLIITSEEEIVEEPKQELEHLSSMNIAMKRRATLYSRHDRIDSKRSIFVDNNDTDKKRDKHIRRISILPVHVDAYSDGKREDRATSCSSTPFLYLVLRLFPRKFRRCQRSG